MNPPMRFSTGTHLSTDPATPRYHALNPINWHRGGPPGWAGAGQRARETKTSVGKGIRRFALTAPWGDGR
jgi:hypothetical protein